MIDVSFEHWRYTFTTEILRRYGSRYYSRKEAGQVLAGIALHQSRCMTSTELPVPAEQVICSNEAFPEAAIADPLADLEIWDEWRNGARAFPYPGRYSKLEIMNQDDKTSSPSSVGVIGEIMAGMFAQVGICPWVLVRVVRKWPDFIFSHRNGMYSFVESKAFTAEPNDNATALQRRVEDSLLREGLLDAMQQLNSDPFGTVWNSFTRVVSVAPMRFDVTFLEINAPDELRERAFEKQMPDVVTHGLAARAVEQGAAKLPRDLIESLPTSSREERKPTVLQLRRTAEEEIPGLLAEAGQPPSDDDSRKPVASAVEKILDRIEKRRPRKLTDRMTTGRRFVAAKEAATESRLTTLRQVGERILYLADLPYEERERIDSDWQPAWNDANSPWGRVANANLWRCGGALFAIGSHELDGIDVRRGSTR
jgi:hypothetical protein